MLENWIDNGQQVLQNGINNPSLNPTASFNFLSGSLDPSITFTRASTATYYNSSGILSTVANNVPRFDYNPSTLALNGLLIEAASTNLCLDSSTATGWTVQGGASFNANAATSPDETSDASQIIQPSGISVDAGIQQSATITSNGVYTYSIYLKYVSNRYVLVNATNFGSTTGWINAVVDLVGGTVTQSGAGSTATLSSTPTLQAIGNGWYRLQMTGSVGTGVTTVYYEFDFVGSGTPAIGNYGRPTTFTGDGASYYYVFGAQIEAATFASSYISTTSSTVTRAADIAYVASIPWFNQAQGSYVWGAIIPGTSGGGGIAEFIVNDGQVNKYYTTFVTAGPRLQPSAQDGGSFYNIGQTLITANTVVSAGQSYSLGNVTGSVNGTTSPNSPANVNPLPPGINTLIFGSNAETGANQNFWLQKLAYWNYQLTQSQLNAQTLFF